MSTRITAEGVVIDYVRPPPILNDTIFAFRSLPDPWRNPSVSAHVEPDPLGPVNSIISLRRNIGDASTRMGSVLYPIRTGSVVTVGEDRGPWGGAGWQGMYAPDEPQPRWLRPHVWFVEVDGRRVLEVPYALALPDPLPTPPAPPWHRRARIALHARSRALADAMAKRLGYVPDDDRDDW